MKTKHLLFISILFLAGVFTVWSCKKDDEKTVTKEDAVSIAKSDAVSDEAYNDIYSESEDIISVLENNKYPAAGNLKSASMSGTRVITVTKNSGDSTIFPKEIKIVYSDYVSNSGIKKNGTILITQSKRMRKVGAVRTVTLQNLILNDTIQLEGKKTITNMEPVNGKPNIKIELSDGKITFNSGNYITRSFTRTIAWESGFTTPFNIWDDIYSFNETAEGSSKNGLSYKSVTTVPLIYKISDLFCIKEGKIEINVEDKMKVYLDFTRTNCLEKIKLTIEGDTESFDAL